MKSLALFIPSFNGGGAERMMLRLASTFADNGYRTDVLVARAHGELEDNVNPKITVVDLNVTRVFSAIPGIIRYLKKERPDVLLATMAHANMAAVIATSVARTKTRVAIRVPITQGPPVKFRNNPVAWSLQRFANVSFKRSNIIIAISEGVAAEIVNLYGVDKEKIETIYNPAFTSDLEALGQEKVDHPWIVQNVHPLIVSAGRLVPQKNFLGLIESFSKIYSKSGCRLIILGDGPERSPILKRIRELNIEDRVSLPGFVKNPIPYFKAADLFVLPSSWEGFGNVIVEALSVGTPVVATDCPSGPAEILGNGLYGDLVPVEDTRELANAIKLNLERQDVDQEALIRRAKQYHIDEIFKSYQQALFR